MDGHRSRTTSPAGGAVKPPRSRILLVGFALLLLFPRLPSAGSAVQDPSGRDPTGPPRKEGPPVAGDGVSHRPRE